MIAGRWILVPVTVGTLMVGRFAFGITAEVTRTIPMTDTINLDVEKHRVEMGSKLQDLGCEMASLVAMTFPDRPSELRLVMTCVKWAEGASYAPTQK